METETQGNLSKKQGGCTSGWDWDKETCEIPGHGQPGVAVKDSLDAQPFPRWAWSKEKSVG